VARDRKRAKQRRQRAPVGRRGDSSARAAGNAGAESAVEPSSEGLAHVPVPGALNHASSDVDEFDAALVRGAGGVPATSDELAEADVEAASSLEGEGEDALQEPGGPSGPGGSGGGDSGGGGDLARPSGAPLRGGNRAIGFLRASWAELQRVQWPDRRHVFQATAVVLGFVIIAGAYLGLADYVAKEIVEFIL
jgi:preprotein translocase subunit SecE